MATLVFCAVDWGGSPIQNFQNAFKKCSIMNFHALGIFPEISSRSRENHYK